MAKIKASHAMMDVFIKWGIQHVYGLPGDSVDTTIDALNVYKKKIKFIQVRHEEVASLAAAAEAKLTGKIGVCATIGGPGAIHLLNGLYDAKMDHVPVLAILGQVNSKLLNTGHFQEVNTPALCEDVAVYNRLVESPESLPLLVDEAIRAAYRYRGVAVLTIPDDMAEKEITDTYHNITGIDNIVSKPAIDEQKMQDAIQLLKNSQRPIVLSGMGCKGLTSELTQFIEANHLPIVQTMPSKGVVADLHANSLGNVGKLGTKPAYEAMKAADLLIMIGTDYPYRPYLPDESKAKCIQVDIDPVNFGKRFPVTVGIHADAADFLTYMNAKGTIYEDDRFLKSCQEAMTSWRNWMNDMKEERGSVIHPPFLMKQIESIANDDAIYSIDVGTATSWGARYIDVKSTQSYIISAWLGTMGCALPGAIGGKLAYPDRQLFSIAGDGAFAMVMQDFVTAVKYKLPFVQFVLNNQKLAFIQYEQQSAGQRNYEIDLHDIDYAKFADACGGKGYTVCTPEALEALMPQLRHVTGPVLVNVYVEDDAPLPGKIVWSEAEGYAKFIWETVKEDHKIPKLPPIKETMKHFF